MTDKTDNTDKMDKLMEELEGAQEKLHTSTDLLLTLIGKICDAAEKDSSTLEDKLIEAEETLAEREEDLKDYQGFVELFQRMTDDFDYHVGIDWAAGVSQTIVQQWEELKEKLKTLT